MSRSRSAEREWGLLFAAWLVAAVATAGSLFFSYVMGFAPCVLCWYQRIFLFPLVVVLAVGLFPVDRGAVRYALPLAVIGWLLAGYHNLVYAGVVPESLQPCSQGVSCTEEYIELFGVFSMSTPALCRRACSPAPRASRAPRSTSSSSGSSRSRCSPFLPSPP